MKTDRLIGILSVLLQKEKTTAPELAERFQVVSIPCMVRIRDGVETGRQVGFLPKDVIAAFLEG